MAYDGIRSADADTFCKSDPLLIPSFFSMSLRLGHEPRIAANTSARPTQLEERKNVLGNAEAAAPVTLENADSILDAIWGAGTGVGAGAGLGAGCA